MSSELKILSGGVVGLLLIASLISWILGKRNNGPKAEATIANLRARTNSWWVMVGVFFLTLSVGPLGSVVLFGLVSFLALREFITLTPSKRADHRALFWVFFIITPLQYFITGIQWYGMFTIFIPVYAFCFLPFRRALAGDHVDFLASVARMQWGLLVCVYFISHLPMILRLPIPGYEGKQAVLLFFLVVVVQASDVFQYVWGKLFGRRKVAPEISPNKTWEGLIGGIGTTTLLGVGLSWATPFSWWQAGLMSLVVCLAGFFGGLVMSAIKRDLGVKDWGDSIPGHGGFLDRIDSLCFAAPLFFHLTGFFFGTGMQPRPPQWLWDHLPVFNQF